MSNLPLPPPAGDTSNEVVGRGPRARRKVDEQRGCRERFPTVPLFSSGGHERRCCRARSPNAPLFGLFGGTVPTSGNSLHRKHVMAVVGNGFQPFRFSPAGDKSNEAVGNGSRTRRFSDCSGNSPYNGTVPTSQTCDGCCRERFPTVPPGRRATTPCTPASGGHEQ